MSLGTWDDAWTLKCTLKHHEEIPEGRYTVHTKEDGSYNGCVAYGLTDENGKETFIRRLEQSGSLWCFFPKRVIINKEDIDYVELYDGTKLTFNN